MIGSGKYGVYLANYAAYGNNGLVGTHTILEMDEDRSSGNDIILKNVGEEAGQRVALQCTVGSYVQTVRSRHKILAEKVKEPLVGELIHDIELG